MLTEADIYILRSPLEGAPKYIGYSTNVKQRIANHISDKRNSPRAEWIASLKTQGLVPVLEIIDTVPVSEAAFWEVHYISLYKSWGFVLTNRSNGGEATLGYKPSFETRKKLSASIKKVGKEIAIKNTLNGTYREAKKTNEWVI